MPPASREAQAQKLRAWLDSIPGQIQKMGAAKGVIAFGWMTPFVCRVELGDFADDGGAFWMDLNPVVYGVRLLLRYATN